nr:hypothetical protein [Tanacetum cinerariifolium]GEY52664.1 hypothetical protein [Tanacetum cinerariifolium]
RNHRRSKQIVKPELQTIVETPVAIMADTHTMSELLQAPTEGYRDAIVIPAILAEDFEKFNETFKEEWDRFKDLFRKCPHHGFLKLHQIDTFYNSLAQSDQDSLNAAAGVNTTTSSSSPSPDITALTDIVKELVLMNKANQQASVNAIEETCVTCGGPHPYYECLATDSNTFNAYATTGTYNLGGNGYLPQGDPNYHVSNQMGPPDFPPPNMQNNQNRYNQNQINYQAPNNQAQVGHSNDFSNYIKTNDISMRAMQNKISNMKTELKNEFKTTMLNQNNEIRNMMSNEIKNMMSTFIQIQSTSSSGSLPSNTIANPRGDVKDISTRSGVAYDRPMIIPTPSPLPKVVKREIEVTKDKVQTTNPESKFTFLADFIIVDYDVDPHVPLILRRPFLRTARALVDVHEEELILRDGDEKLIFHADSTPKHPHKHGNESINMINFIDITCEDHFPEDIDYEKDKNTDFKMKSLVVEAHSVESNDLLPQLLDSDSNLPEESSEIASLSSSPFKKEDKDCLGLCRLSCLLFYPSFTRASILSVLTYGNLIS